MALATKPKASTTPFSFDTAPIVTVVQHAYRVDWGENVRPRWHTVSKLKHCQCALGKDCPSVSAVADYLTNGGQRAPEYADDFWPSVPAQCPVCGRACVAYPAFNFRTHGVGWTCVTGGTLHYWEARARPIQKALAARAGQPHWVIPPVRVKDGKTIHPGIGLVDVETTQAAAWLYHPCSYVREEDSCLP